MNKNICHAVLTALLLVSPSLTSVARAQDLRVESEKAIKVLQNTDSGLSNVLSHSAGYVVFPSVGKGGLFFGAEHGNGLVYEKGKPVGEATLTEINVGPQVGGQAFYEVIVFETADALSNFKQGNYEMSAEASAVGVVEGASVNAKYRAGIMVFTLPRAGVMLDASIGGQKFKYAPLNGNASN
jgi:lipid-binding SYLF domain-containing protein